MRITAWNKIVDAFKEGPAQALLHITKTETGPYTFSAGNRNASSEIKSAYLFEELIGRQRLKRICERVNIDRSSPAFLSRENVHKIFLGMMDIRKEDMDEREGAPAKRYRELLFFDHFNHFKKSFIQDSPNIEDLRIDTAKSSGKGLKGLTERISLLAYHHFALLTDENRRANAYCDVEMLTSRLADREMQKGSVVHLHNGYYYVDEVFIKGGAYIAVLRDFEDRNPPKIVFRGTAMRRTATDGFLSGLNDVLLEIGTMGVKKVWPDLSKYLKNHQIQKVEILGKSLGGAQAQQLAILLEGVLGITVDKLITYCSVGAGGKEINQLFNDEILAKRTTPFNIQVLRIGGNGADKKADYIPFVGGDHLGTGTKNRCNIEVTYLGPGEEIEPCSLKLGVMARIKRFVFSFLGPHCRQETLKKFHWRTIEEGGIEKHLKLGNQLEPIRKIIAWAFNCFTLFVFNRSSFTSFYHNAKVQKEPVSKNWTGELVI